MNKKLYFGINLVVLPDGMGCGQLGHGDVTGSLVRDQGVFCGLLSVVGGGELRQIPVIIPLHLVVENFGLTGVGTWDQMFVQNAENVAADVL